MEKIPFNMLKVGDQFSITSGGTYLNIRVEPARLVDGELGTYNVISLRDGRPSTFSDTELVWVQDSDNRSTRL